MGYALIIGGGEDGRYTIEIDIGEAQRTALVEKFTEQAAEAQAKLAAAQATLAEKQATLDAAALAYEVATEAYIEVLRNDGDVQDGDAYLEIVNGHAKAQAEYLSARVAHSAALANRNALSLSATTITKALAGWQAQVLTETRDAWCVDLTEDADGYVATLEIPGESGLILLAPGGRSWLPGDGNISLAYKNARLAILAARLASIDAQLLANEQAISAKVALETTQKTARDQAITNLQTNDDPAEELRLLMLVNTATDELTATQNALASLRLSRNAMVLKRAYVLLDIAKLTAAPAIEVPLAGDGYLQSRGLMSPWQAYFNAAILPGWQKFKPTYRWGTATDVDYDADTMTVNINDTKSSAQALSVNQSDELVGVPVVYMTCNAGAFEVGDRVVIEFQGQDWESPRVIGFLDNPKKCCETDLTIYFGAGYPAVYGGTPMLIPVPGHPTQIVECGDLSEPVTYPAKVSDGAYTHVWAPPGLDDQTYLVRGGAWMIAGYPYASNSDIVVGPVEAVDQPGSSMQTMSIAVPYHGRVGPAIVVSAVFNGSGYSCTATAYTTSDGEYLDGAMIFNELSGSPSGSQFDGRIFTRDTALYEGPSIPARVARLTMVINGQMEALAGEATEYYRQAQILSVEILP